MTPGVYVTADMLKRRLIYDAMEDPASVLALLDMVGDSAEGAPMEHRASEARLESVEPLQPLLNEMSSWMAEVATRVQTEGNPHADEIIDDMYQMFLGVVRCSVFSILSVLFDLGLIHPGSEVGE